MTFRTPSLAGSSGEDSPSLTGWGSADYQADQESNMNVTREQLSKLYDVPNFDGFDVPVEARNSFYVGMGRWMARGIDSFWGEPEAGKRLFNPEVFPFVVGARFAELSGAYNGKQTQSPIEDMMLGALLWMELDWALFPEIEAFGPLRGEDGTFGEHLRFSLTPQAPVAGYHVDFLLSLTMNKAVGGIAIECDGHDFHEKTKEQAARDKKRDREILAAGYPVVRFSGSEVFKDASGCVDQIYELMSESLFRVSKEGGLF